jgi:putative transposase
VHAVQVSQWKKELLSNLAGVFEGKRPQKPTDDQEDPAKLYEQIGRLKVANDWLKKNLNNYPSSERKQLVDADFEAISVRRQCELLSVCRSSIYYEPEMAIVAALTDDALMNLLDAQYTSTPFYGSRKMAKAISLQTGLEINRKRVQRLMRVMAISAIYPKPNTSKPSKQNRVYP